MKPSLLESTQRLFMSLPHSALLKLRYVGCEEMQPVVAVDWRQELVGNPGTGVLHGGVITSLVDVTSALAVVAMLDEVEALATLDMRIDYLRGAEPRQTVYCRAECYRLARHIAFVRALCYQDNEHDPIAQGVVTFMRESSRKVMIGAP